MAEKLLLVAKGTQVKMALKLSSITIKPDGTIWYLGAPLLGITDPAVRAKTAGAVKANKFDQIPTYVFTRLGDNPNGLWVGDLEAWNAHLARMDK